MPGKLLQKLGEVGINNPLFLLDEIDKLGMDHRGDSASALLEVLDPEQNSHFNDHYLEVDYDLSNVMFICTSNSMNIPGHCWIGWKLLVSLVIPKKRSSILPSVTLPQAVQGESSGFFQCDISEQAIREAYPLLHVKQGFGV